MMMLGARCGAWAKSGGPTARDYNLPLITHMYDAVENLGFGVTDHTVGRWVDCITGDEKTFTIGANSKWEDNSFKRTVALGNFVLNIPAVESGTTTVIVFKNDTPAGTTNPRIVGTSTTARRFEIDIYDSSPTRSPRYYWRTNGTYRTAPGDLGLSFANLLSMAYIFNDDGLFYLSVNGNAPVQTGGNYPIDYDFYSAGVTTLNVGANNGTSSAMAMTLKSVRRYSSILTASQLSAEYAIDRARFDLP